MATLLAKMALFLFDGHVSGTLHTLVKFWYQVCMYLCNFGLNFAVYQDFWPSSLSPTWQVFSLPPPNFFFAISLLYVCYFWDNTYLKKHLGQHPDLGHIFGFQSILYKVRKCTKVVTFKFMNLKMGKKICQYSEPYAKMTSVTHSI